MKKILYLFLFLSSSVLYSQWNWLNPSPQGNLLTEIVYLFNGNIIAAGNCGTIIVSTNNGSNWIVTHKIHDTTSGIKTLFKVNDNLIYAGSFESKILRSTNGGLNWIFLSRISNSIYGLKKITFTDQFTGFALTYSSSIFKTTNGGINWFLGSTLPQFCQDMFFINSTTGFIVGGAVTDNSESINVFIKTTNGGINWSNVPIQLFEPLSKIQFSSVNTGYTSAYDRLFKTTNAGDNWYQLTSFNVGNAITFINFFNDNLGLVCEGDANIHKTTNGGVNWATVFLQYYTFNADRGISSLSFLNEADGVIMLNSHVILKTLNSGLNWQRLTSSMNLYSPLKAIEFLNSNTAILGGWGTTDDFILRKTTDGGLNWIGTYASNYQNSTGYIYDIDFQSALTGYAVGGGNSKGYVYKSTSAGNNWVKMDSIGTSSINKCCFINDNTGFAVGRFNQIYKTTNGALSWTAFPTSSSNGFNSVFFTDNNTGYVCSGNSNPQLVLRTTNSGINWDQIYSMTGSSFSDIYFINNNTGYIASKGILKTTDGGFSWIQKAPNHFNYFHGIRFSSVNTGYAYGEYGKIIKSTDAGESWGELNSPTDYFFSDINFLNDNTGFLVGDQGMILKTTNGGGNFVIGINDPVKNIPSDFLLQQNYPNPFNPVTTIKFSISENSFVNITIYDILGKEVATLLNENRNPGNYELNWDAGKNSSGVYFYRMTVDGKSFEKKMVLIK